MQTYDITQNEIKQLKQTMGFRVNEKTWFDFVESHPEGCNSSELIDLVKTWMNPPYDVKDVDAYLEDILKLFVNFVRHSKMIK